jgi:succinoglycan biosynthesis transport protein ExoP
VVGHGPFKRNLMDFIYLFRVLLKRKWLIMLAGVMAAAIAWALTRNEAKKYRSTAQISTGFTISDEIKVNDENFSFYEADVKFNNVIVTFESPTVISLLSYSLILHDLKSPEPFRQLTQVQKNSPIYTAIDKNRAISTFEYKLESMSMLTSFKPDEKALLEFLALYRYDYQTLSHTLPVYRLERTDYIQIDYTSENPELSAFVVNTAFQQFLRYYKNVRSSKSQESIDTLQSLLERKKQELDLKNSQLKSQGMIDVGEENTAKLEAIINQQTTLTEEESRQTQRNYDIQKINQRIAKLSSSSPTNSVAKTDNDNSELLTLRRSMTEANQSYINSGSSDPTLLKKYQALKTEYANKLASIQNAVVPTPSATSSSTDDLPTLEGKKSDLEIDIRAGVDKIVALQNRISDLKVGLVKDASKDAEVTSLLKDAELANKEYLSAKQKYNDAMDINSSSVNNFRQVLSGQPAIDPEPSQRIIIVGMAGASALVITTLVIILLTYLDSSIKTPIIFSKTVNLRLLSMVNFLNLGQRSLQEIIIDRVALSDIRDNRHNVFLESLRKLRYEIEHSGKKTILFASTKKGEGKTTLILALSYSMSLSKKKILIIDTNFCNNDLTVALDAERILENIHPDKISPNSLVEQVKTTAKDIGVGTVYVIGCQVGDYTPSEILPRENLLQHLNELTSEFDYIFLEGPPLNDFSDAKELSQYVDGVIAIFSATHIIKQIDRQSMNFFDELDGKFVGAVLNMVDLKNVNTT